MCINNTRWYTIFVRQIFLSVSSNFSGENQTIARASRMEYELYEEREMATKYSVAHLQNVIFLFRQKDEKNTFSQREY